MLQHVFNNHYNVNMNDIQNSYNYSHRLTSPGSAFDTLPVIWPCKKCCINVCLHSFGSHSCMCGAHSETLLMSDAAKEIEESACLRARSVVRA